MINGLLKEKLQLIKLKLPEKLLLVKKEIRLKKLKRLSLIQKLRKLRHLKKLRLQRKLKPQKRFKLQKKFKLKSLKLLNLNQQQLKQENDELFYLSFISQIFRNIIIILKF
jgi:hypothetical protein